jgi:hypothetical protein
VLVGLRLCPKTVKVSLFGLLDLSFLHGFMLFLRRHICLYALFLGGSFDTISGWAETISQLYNSLGGCTTPLVIWFFLSHFAYMSSFST